MRKIRVIIISIILIIIGVICLIVYHLKSSSNSSILKTALVPHSITQIKVYGESSAKSNVKSKQKIQKDLYGNIVGRVIAEDTGKGISSVGLIVSSIPAGMETYDRYGIVTDRDGFYIKRLPAGNNYKVCVSRYSHLAKADLSKYILRIPSNCVDVEIPKYGGEVKAKDIVLKTGGSIRIRLFEADGKTLVDSDKVERILIKIPDYFGKDKDWIGSTQGMVTALYESDGTYLINGIPDTKRAELTAMVYGYAHVNVKNVGIKRNKTTGPIDIIIPTNDPTGIEGIITDKQTGKPISGATIVLDKYVPPEIMRKPAKDWPQKYHSYHNIGSALTDNQGRYFIKGIKPGAYTFFVMRLGYNVVDKGHVNGPIKIISNKKLIFNLTLSQSKEKFRFTTEYVKDPAAVIDSSCDNLANSISQAFNWAMEAFQSCLPGIYKDKLQTAVMNISCALAPPDSDNFAECGYFSGGDNIIIYTDTNGGFKCGTGLLLDTIYHETLHALNYGEADAYTCQYACLNTGCVSCAGSGLCSNVTPTSANRCVQWPTPSDQNGCNVCDAATLSKTNSCEDHNECTEDTCNKHKCSHKPKNCDDNNFCTIDSCDPTIGCKHDPIKCPDVACMNNLGCQNGGCQYSPIKCPPRRCAMGVCSGGSCQYTQNRCPDENEFVSVGAPFTTISFNEHAPVGVL